MAHGATEERRTNRGPAARRHRPRTRSLPVGAMALMGGLAIAGALLWIDDRQLLFAPTFEVYADFARLNSIRRGAAVHVAGAAAGEVSGIRLPRRPAEKFRLTLRIREPFHGLVRTNSVVSLQSIGAVGSKIVQIEPGPDAAPQAPPGSTLAVAEDNDAADPLSRARSVLMSVDTALDTARVKLGQFRSRTGGDSHHSENEAASLTRDRSGRRRLGREATRPARRAGCARQPPDDRGPPRSGKSDIAGRARQPRTPQHATRETCDRPKRKCCIPRGRKL